MSAPSPSLSPSIKSPNLCAWWSVHWNYLHNVLSPNLCPDSASVGARTTHGKFMLHPASVSTQVTWFDQFFFIQFVMDECVPSEIRRLHIALLNTVFFTRSVCSITPLSVPNYDRVRRLHIALQSKFAQQTFCWVWQSCRCIATGFKRRPTNWNGWFAICLVSWVTI